MQTASKEVQWPQAGWLGAKLRPKIISALSRLSKKAKPRATETDMQKLVKKFAKDA